MSKEVHLLIPNALRGQAGGKDCVSVEAASVGEALGGLCSAYPELGKRLFKSEGQLNRFVNVYVNDEDIRFLSNLETELRGGDEVAIVPAIAGG